MSLDRLARTLFRRRRAVLCGSLATVLVAGILGGPVFGILDSENDFDDPAAEAVQAREEIARATGASASPDVVVLVRLGVPAGSRAGQARIDRVAAALRDPGVAGVGRYRPGGDRSLVSRDGASTYLLATYRTAHGGAGGRIKTRLGHAAGVYLGGNEFAQDQVGETVSRDIGRAEMLAFPILFLLSLLVFRSAVSALLPLAVGATTILLSFVVMRVVNEFTGMSIYALNLINGMGLGLAIDYSLFQVSRFREELAGGRDREDALAATMRTAGRTVVFSAVTVAAALAALLVFPQRFLYSMGVGGVTCALIAALVSSTLLPALLGALGERVNAGAPRRWKRSVAHDATGEASGFWYRLSRAVMRRPLPVATGAALLLVVVGIPFWGIRFTGVDASVLPSDKSARVVDDALKTEFPPNASAPVFVSVHGPAGAVRAYADRLGRLPGVQGPPRVSRGRIDLLGPAPALGQPAKDLVQAVRGVPAPFPAKVGGQTAQFVDQQHSLASHLPLGLAILAATTLVILFLMTGSVVLPIKALVMNVLTLSAAFGLLVLVFQDGHGERLLGFTSQHALESSQPVLLFAVAFALSTDYGVFLLSRIKELHDRGLPNEEAVAQGLQRTGRLVTYVALLIMVAIGAFVTSQIIFIKELGLGTAMAVGIDATIVRALLVPALMRMLGDWNWWAPRPLVRLHARWGIREAPA